MQFHPVALLHLQKVWPGAALGQQQGKRALPTYQGEEQLSDGVLTVCFMAQGNSASLHGSEQLPGAGRELQQEQEAIKRKHRHQPQSVQSIP